VGTIGGLDHNTIFLELTKVEDKPPSPFKFNLVWLEDATFVNLVKREWIPYNIYSRLIERRKFPYYLLKLKKKWWSGL
jgi:hypothetical protein